MSAAAQDGARRPVQLDGAAGEGGGQIVRSALSLALLTGRPLELTRIRARRRKPGLLRQHLTAVQAAARVGSAQLEGAELGSGALRFVPRALHAGRYDFDIGSAGSTTLVAQTLLPALLAADGPSRLVIDGGTHNPLAPSFDFLQRSYAPALAAMGAQIELTLVRPGFHPAGGGRLEVVVTPATLQPLERLERGPVQALRACCAVADLPRSIAEREAEVLRRKLRLPAAAVAIVELPNGPGNYCTVDVVTAASTEVFTSFGAPRLPAERVAAQLVRDVKAFLRAERSAVGPHLADQLLLPLALAGGGRFRTLRATSHTETNARVIEAFLPVRIELQQDDTGCLVAVTATGDVGRRG